MAQFPWNLEVLLVPVLDMDILGITKQNIEWTQILLATSVEKLGISKQLATWEYKKVIKSN